MLSAGKINFTAQIVKEHSYTPRLENLGQAQCSMELFTFDGSIPSDGNGHIEWFLEYLDGNGKPNGDDDVQEIGVWFEAKTLCDYDGLFSLPKEAVKLLRQVGIRVPKEFEN